MKKQHFYIFYIENEKNTNDDDIQLKLVKKIMNYSCIDESKQSEVIEVHQLKTIRNIFNRSGIVKISTKLSGNDCWDYKNLKM